MSKFEIDEETIQNLPENDLSQDMVIYQELDKSEDDLRETTGGEYLNISIEDGKNSMINLTTIT